MQVLYLAKKYMMPSLTPHCRSFLEANINAENVLDVLPVLDKLEEAHLTGVCWNVVDSNAEEILQSSSASLLQDHKDLLVSMLSRDTLKIDEIKIFQAVNRWAEHICIKRGLTPSGKEKRKVIGETILKLIRFPLMPQKEFAEQVPDSKILTETEINQMFMYFSLSRKPGEFSCIPRCMTTRSIHRCKRFHGSGRLGFTIIVVPPVNSILFTVNVPVLLRGVRLLGSKGETYFVKLTISGATVAEGRFQTETEERDGYHGFDIIFEQYPKLTPDAAYNLEALITGPKSSRGVFCKDKVVCGEVTFQFFALPNSVSKGQRITEILFTPTTKN